MHSVCLLFVMMYCFKIIF